VLVQDDQDSMFFENMGKSVFCLSPAGAGWSHRTTLAALYGCIPVILQDDIAQPFEELLPYDRFAVRVKEEDIEELPDLLRSIPSACNETLGLLHGHRCVPRMRAELACAARYFLWSSVFGSAFGESGDLDAFAVSMLALQEKVETWVHGRQANKLDITSACDVPDWMGCLRVANPICRYPCKSRARVVSSASMTWPPGGAFCRDARGVRGNTCNE
ncbi:hypothetical protein CYMTET_25337, partial [Cymbomonas tetramitiformis]